MRKWRAESDGWNSKIVNEEERVAGMEEGD